MVLTYIYIRKNDLYHYSKRNVHKNMKKTLVSFRLRNYSSGIEGQLILHTSCPIETTTTT